MTSDKKEAGEAFVLPDGFDLELLAPGGGEASEMFLRAVEASERDIALLILGRTQVDAPSSSYAVAQIHGDMRARLVSGG